MFGNFFWGSSGAVIPAVDSEGLQPHPSDPNFKYEVYNALPITDAFDGEGDSSGAVGDDNFNRRFEITSGSAGDFSIASDELTATIDVASTKTVRHLLDKPHVGAFTVTTRYDFSTHDMASETYLRLRLYTSEGEQSIWNSWWPAGHEFVRKINGNAGGTTNTTAFAGWFRITAGVNSAINIEHSTDGVNFTSYNSGAYNNNSTMYSIELMSVRLATGNGDDSLCIWKDLVVTDGRDGAGDNIISKAVNA